MIDPDRFDEEPLELSRALAIVAVPIALWLFFAL